MNKGLLSNLLRRFRLIYTADYLRFCIAKVRNSSRNRDFIRNNPGVNLPPDYLMYESFRLDYNLYYNDGKESAAWILNLLGRHMSMDKISILDWGCGPGRIVRHLPGLLGAGSSVYGTDYNKNTIDWCRSALPGIEFNHNSGSPPLPYQDNYFGAIYGLSVITHLSEENHYLWLAELLRVLQPGGLLLLTSQGDNFREKLTPAEQDIFDLGEPVIRGNVKEGHRTYSAFHPQRFMEKLFAGCEILEHITREPSGANIPQDIWIVRKAR